MTGIVIAVVCFALLVLSGVVVVRKLARRRIHATLFTAPRMTSARPSDAGLDYEQIAIPLADRTLQAWFSQSPDALASVLFFHGQDDALSSLVNVFDRLRRERCTVMAFNYSGHGNSTGTPTVENVRADCVAALEMFLSRADAGPKIVLGYSLGAAVLLDVLSHHDVRVDGVVLASPFASVRAVAIADGVPAWMSFIVPDVYNNTRAIASIQTPVLIVHSMTDGTFPISMAQEIHAAAQTSELCIVASPSHEDVIAAPIEREDADAYWQAIFRFISRPWQGEH